MFTVGVVLLVMVGVLTADIVVENSGQTDVLIMGQLLSFDTWGLFVFGLTAGVLVVAGIQLVAQGMARDRRRRQVERQRRRELAAMTAARPSPAPAMAPARPAGPVPAAVVPAPAPVPVEATKTPARGSAAPVAPTAQRDATKASPARPDTAETVAVRRSRWSRGSTQPTTAGVVSPDQPVSAQPVAAAVPAVPAPSGRPAPSGPVAPSGPAPTRPTTSPVDRTAGYPPATSPSTPPTRGTAPRGDRVVARVSDLRRRKAAPADTDAPTGGASTSS